MNNFLQKCIIINDDIEYKKVNNLNFKNEDSVTQRKLAYEDLISAKTIAEASKNNDENKKALNRKAKQIAMEAVEHANKSVIYADDKNENFSSNLHSKLEKTHNNKYLQREMAKQGINIIDSNDVDILNESIKNIIGKNSPYNSIRYNCQDISDISVSRSISVAEKSIRNLNRMIEENNKTIIEIDGLKVMVEI